MRNVGKETKGAKSPGAKKRAVAEGAEVRFPAVYDPLNIFTTTSLMKRDFFRGHNQKRVFASALLKTSSQYLG